MINLTVDELCNLMDDQLKEICSRSFIGIPPREIMEINYIEIIFTLNKEGASND